MPGQYSEHEEKNDTNGNCCHNQLHWNSWKKESRMSSCTDILSSQTESELQLFNRSNRKTEINDESDSPIFSIVQINGKGCGVQANDLIKCGQVIFREEAFVIGPKQTSPLVCVECCKILEGDGESEVDCHHCDTCCLPMCTKCFENPDRFNHILECEVFQQANFKALTSTNTLIKTKSEASKIYPILTPLRLLLLADKDRSIYRLEGNLERRADTVLFCFNQVNIVKFLHEKLFLGQRFSSNDIHRACGILDTNCYELGWKGTRARGIFKTIARINHDCVPNARKFFTADKNMIVVASRDIKPGEEITLSYTPPLTSTPVRQILLQQTKFFNCLCERCKDPTEFGSLLSALKCHHCQVGMVLPIDPMNPSTDYSCQDCLNIVESFRCKFVIETAMRFVGQEVSPTDKIQNILEIIKNLERFVSPSNQLIANLKLQLINEICQDESEHQTVSKESLKVCFSFCKDLIRTCQLIAPGMSRLNGMLSKKYHIIQAKLLQSDIHLPTISDVTVLNPDEINQIFKDDVSSKEI